jgi:hypothetical protein
MRVSPALVFLFSVLAVHTQQRCVAESVGQHVLLHDPTGHTLRSSTASVSPAAAAAALCSAAGLVTPVNLHGDSAATVEGLVQPQSVLGQAPKAVLMLHMSGISPGTWFGSTTLSKQHSRSHHLAYLACLTVPLLSDRLQQLGKAPGGLGGGLYCATGPAGQHA